jgi:UDP-2-acetamido-3-amino-2,3-dideoxy-glucuronate N-acetyltransferase
MLDAAQKSLDSGGEACRPEERSAPIRLGYDVHPTAVVDPGATIGAGSRIWHFSHVSPDVEIGTGCNFGQNVFVAPGVRIGNNVKVQNNVSIYTGVTLEDDVFLGPSAVLTNVTNPRSQVNRRELYEKTRIGRGATVGANATIVCGVNIGRYAFVAAGAVVTRDVPDYALVVGSPGRRTQWMSRHGHVLEPNQDGELICPESGFRYEEIEPNVLRCLDQDEDTPLDSRHAVGHVEYRSIRRGR